jgi:ParB family chromosome partitioning protein
MNDLTSWTRSQQALRELANERRALGPWKPKQASTREELANAFKRLAEVVKNWALLDDAVDQQISDQQNFVDWWFGVPGDADKPRHVRPPGQGNNHGPGYFSKEEALALGGIPQQKASRWKQALAGDREEYRDLLRGPSWRKAMGERGSTDQKGTNGTGENEWFTPDEHIELAREMLGTIDLDPASSAAAQEIVQAAAFYSKDDDGLQQEWHGKVFLNPPYSQPLLADFIHKLCEEISAGRVTEAILLTHNYTDTAWFHEIFAHCSAICFTRGRVKFYDADKIAQPTQGQAFSYFGPNVAGFTEVFRTIGSVVNPSR